PVKHLLPVVRDNESSHAVQQFLGLALAKIKLVNDQAGRPTARRRDGLTLDEKQRALLAGLQPDVIPIGNRQGHDTLIDILQVDADVRSALRLGLVLVCGVGSGLLLLVAFRQQTRWILLAENDNVNRTA